MDLCLPDHFTFPRALILRGRDFVVSASSVPWAEEVLARVLRLSPWGPASAPPGALLILALGARWAFCLGEVMFHVRGFGVLHCQTESNKLSLLIRQKY